MIAKAIDVATSRPKPAIRLLRQFPLDASTMPRPIQEPRVSGVRYEQLGQSTNQPGDRCHSTDQPRSTERHGTLVLTARLCRVVARGSSQTARSRNKSRSIGDAAALEHALQHVGRGGGVRNVSAHASATGDGGTDATTNGVEVGQRSARRSMRDGRGVAWPELFAGVTSRQ